MTASPQRRDPFVGIVLDEQYELIELLARGGMGRVYRGMQRSLQREVAIKVLDMEQLDGKAARADFERRFFLEAASLAKLKHPNTVVVYDYGRAEAEDVFYIVMEMLEGTTLDAILEEQGSLPPKRAVHIALQIAGSLAEAHEQGLVHRDLKPSNAILGRRGADPDYVKVIDFGLVKADDTKLTQSGALLGTPRYMAPEQIANDEVGPAADIYGLGATLYHMLTGRPPFDSDSKFVLLAAHMNVAVPPFAEVAPDLEVTQELEDIVMRCLSKDPAERFASMEGLARALSFSGETTGTLPSSMPSGSGEIAAFDTGKPAPVDPTSAAVDPTGSTEIEPGIVKSKQRNVLIAALVAGGLLAAGAVAWVRGRDEPPPPEVAAPPEVSEDPPAEEVVPEEPTEEPGATEITRVQIDTVPAGAHLSRDGRDLGDAPSALVVPRGESWEIAISADGYETRNVTITGGQQAITVNLDPEPQDTRRRRTRRATMDAPMEAAMEVETAMETEPTMDTSTTTMTSSMTRQSENRDPWAR
ncbi:MAG: serine/threonine protein kinase [Deltaproteobacteria bacterium]|nr:serine/threonine protein kinase [Deltaproteobacteria bacterium]